MTKRAAIVLAFMMSASPAAAEPLQFRTILGADQALFTLGTGSSGAAATLPCESLVNSKPERLHRALNDVFKDSSESFAQTMPKAVDAAIEACKAKGFQANPGASSQRRGQGRKSALAQ
jgi:hypothetical protein